MIIAGFDIATLKSGAAIIEADGRTFLYSLKLDDKTSIEERIHRHAEWAEGIAARHKVEICFHEEVINVERDLAARTGKTMNISTALKIAQCVGAVKAAFYPAIIYGIAPSEWRKLTVGNIPAKKGLSERDNLKAAAISFAVAQGLKPRNDDEAEAFCIAKCGEKITTILS